MQIFVDAHYTLGECNQKMFFSATEVEKCQKAWGAVEDQIKQDRDGTLFELYKCKSEIQHSVKFLAIMFGKGDLLQPPVEA